MIIFQLKYIYFIFLFLETSMQPYYDHENVHNLSMSDDSEEEVILINPEDRDSE